MITHWDELGSRRRERGHLAGTWQSLTGHDSLDLGVQRIAIDPGKWATPLHMEGSEEEIFYVLAGDGVSVQRDGVDGTERAFAIGEGDCLVHLAARHAHTLRAGERGLTVLAFGERHPMPNGVLPRTGLAWFGTRWVQTLGMDDHPFTREAEVGPPAVGEEEERWSFIVNADAVEAGERRGATVSRTSRDLGRAAGSVRTGLRVVDVDPGMLMAAPHCHSSEEEIFVVIGGDGVLELIPGPRPGDASTETTTHPVRVGCTITRRAGTGVAHTFRAGADGMRVIAYGQRRGDDMTYYPRSNKIAFRGVGVIARLEQLDYWDGED